MRYNYVTPGIRVVAQVSLIGYELIGTTKDIFAMSMGEKLLPPRGFAHYKEWH